MPFPKTDFISSPVNATGNQTDKDSSENDGDVNINNNVPGNILKVQVEIRGIQNEDNYHEQQFILSL